MYAFYLPILTYLVLCVYTYIDVHAYIQVRLRMPRVDGRRLPAAAALPIRARVCPRLGPGPKRWSSLRGLAPRPRLPARPALAARDAATAGPAPPLAQRPGRVVPGTCERLQHGQAQACDEA